MPDFPMHYMSPDLAILSAEQYDHGVRSPAGKLTRKPPVKSLDNGTGPRKRAKTKADERRAGAEEEKKRSRGRPRLDTKDETAAERRRTQIRLAQRAYRNRKENAISSLEKRVQDLRNTNEAMSNAFMKLHDFAVSEGLLDEAPEFGRQLQATTEKFLTLARRSSNDDDDDIGDDEMAGSLGIEAWDQTQTTITATQVPGMVEDSSSTEEIDKSISNTDTQTWGYIISYEADDDLTSSLAVAPNPPPIPETLDETLDYEIITQPTFENASFPIAAPNVDTGDFSALLSNPYASVPAPYSYAHLESTFGRRLQRYTIERGYALLSAPNPDPRHFARVFGFCIVFESLDKIKERLRVALDKPIGETLNHWQFPFVNLGGAGTQLSFTDVDRQMGNADTHDPLRPKFNTGFSQGPFNAAVTNARDTRLDPKLRIKMPGFEGNFLDCDETELYLHQRGVDIPPGADTVVVDVDVTDFDDKNMRNSISSSAFQPAAPLFDLSNSNGLETAGDIFKSAEGVFGSGQTSNSGSSSSSDALEPPGFLIPPNPYMPPASAAPDFGDSSLPAFSGMPLSSRSGNGSLVSTRKLVTINVNLLLKELMKKATCLGRTPGFKQSDVNAAFWVATK